MDQHHIPEKFAGYQCPKCQLVSRDWSEIKDWEQCKNRCPIPASKYFNSITQNACGETIKLYYVDALP